MAHKTTPVYQRGIQDVLRSMGRSDIGVEEVSVAGEDVLSVAFVRGLRIRRIELPLDRLVDRAQVRAAIEAAPTDFTPRGSELQPAAAALPETRFQEKDRQHRAERSSIEARDLRRRPAESLSRATTAPLSPFRTAE